MRGRLVEHVWRADPTRYAPPRHRRACRYGAFIPDPISRGGNLPQITAGLLGLVSDAEQSVAELNRTMAPELEGLGRLLLRTESIASSRVEDMQADVRALARAEAKRSAGRSIGSQAAEIIANIDAMIHAVDEAAGRERLRTDDLLSIHRRLLGRAPTARIAGKVRDVQNWIGGNNYTPCGAAFVPPPPEEVAPLLDDLCGFCNEETLPPLIQAAIAHAQFETIHPFEDGNGRTGRALIQVLLRRRGLAPSFVPPVSVAFSLARDRYIRGLELFREDRVPEWIETFAEATASAAFLARRYAALVADLQRHWRERLRETVNPRSDAAAWAIIDALPAHPVITSGMAALAVARSQPAVDNGIEQLERSGVLIPLGASKRYRTWEPEGLIDLIEELEAGGAQPGRPPL